MVQEAVHLFVVKKDVCVWGGVVCMCCVYERERISLLFTRLYIQNFHQLTIILKTSEQGLKTILLRIVHIKTVNWEFLKKLKKLERGQIGPVQIYWWRQGNCTLLLLSDIFSVIYILSNIIWLYFFRTTWVSCLYLQIEYFF